jgi:hypothetical protein
MTIHKSATIVGPNRGVDLNSGQGIGAVRARTRGAVAVVAVMIAMLALAGSALAGGFTARLYAAGHQPRVGYWPIKVTATRGSQKLSGDVNYEFVWHGMVVSHQPGHRFRNGVFRDKLLWPAKAVGHTITLRVVVKTRYGTDYINWWIRVRR